MSLKLTIDNENCVVFFTTMNIYMTLKQKREWKSMKNFEISIHHNLIYYESIINKVYKKKQSRRRCSMKVQR